MIQRLNRLANGLRDKRTAERGIRAAIKARTGDYPLQTLDRAQVEALKREATEAGDKATADLCRTWLVLE